MMTKCTVGYHFYTLDTWKHRVIKAFSGSNITHVITSIETEQGILYYDCTWRKLSNWYSDLGPYTPPLYSLYEDVEMDLQVLDLLLPKGEFYSLWKVVSHLLFGYPRSPSSCISSVHRLRYLCGKQSKGRSPGAVYKHLSKELRDRPSSTGSDH